MTMGGGKHGSFSCIVFGGRSAGFLQKQGNGRSRGCALEVYVFYVAFMGMASNTDRGRLAWLWFGCSPRQTDTSRSPGHSGDSFKRHLYTVIVLSVLQRGQCIISLEGGRELFCRQNLPFDPMQPEASLILPLRSRYTSEILEGPKKALGSTDLRRGTSL